MESILFLMAYPLEDGKRHLTQKFDAQIKASERLGLDTWYTAYGKGKIYLCHGENKTCIGKGFRNSQNILQSHSIFKKINLILKSHKFNYCYIRMVPPIPSYIYALNKIKLSKCKIIVEIPTYPVETERRNSNRKLFFSIINIIEKINGKKEARYIDLYTLIGAISTKYKGIPAINIQNGVNIDAFPLKEQGNKRSDEIHMLALACMSYWHGYDRIIKGLKNYYKKNPSITVYLHLIGNAGDASLEEWRELVQEYGLEQYVTFNGFQTGEILNKSFDECDVAIGSLGLYRKGLETASSIKEAEYYARGIPFIYTGKNLLLNDNLQFCLKVINDDTDIDICQVIDFVEKIRQQDNVQRIMRNYAEKNMTWESQLIKVLNSLNS